MLSCVAFFFELKGFIFPAGKTPDFLEVFLEVSLVAA